MSDALISTEGLSRSFRIKGGTLQALSNINIACRPGRSLGIVGESGCGKTTLNRLLLMLDRPTGGRVFFRGKALDELSATERRAYRKAVQPVFQNPYSSLNPRLRVRGIIAEPLAAATTMGRKAIAARVDEVLQAVGLTVRDGEKFPGEFSGGQRQRIAIARAIASKPELLVLDEPVSSQDISIRAQILNLLKELRDEYGLATLFVSHDLATVRFMCDEVAVIYLGRVVEQGSVEKICDRPEHPYTRALLASALPASPDLQRTDTPPIGEIPSPLDPPSGCAYHPRCPFVRGVCRETRPELGASGQGGDVACHMIHAKEW